MPHTTSLPHQVIIQAILTYHGLKSDNKFKVIKARQTAKLWKDVFDLWYGYDVTKFKGHNPLTGFPVIVIFNTPIPNKTSIMNFNPLLKSWMYSANAGLTWKQVEFSEYVEKTDCLI